MNITLATKYYTTMTPLRQRRMESVIIKFLLDKLEDNGITDPEDPAVEDPQPCLICGGLRYVDNGPVSRFENGEPMSYAGDKCTVCEGTGVV